MARLTRIVGLIGTIAFAFAAGATWLPALVWPDAAIPPSLSASLPAARHRAWTEAADGMLIPLHLTFVEARCDADGRVAYIFEEHRPPYVERRYSYVIGTDGSASGGSGLTGQVASDAEFVHVMGTNTTPCT